METLDFYLVGENGQVEINFDSLLFLTNEDFVWQVQTFVTSNYENIKVNVFESDMWLSVTICSSWCGSVEMARYQKNKLKGSETVVHYYLMPDDINMIKQLLN